MYTARMPLVAHSDLPSFEDLRLAGHDVLSLSRARQQDIRELHIGFLNMMPDAALRATERQFIRLIGSCNRIAQFFVHPFSLPGLSRGASAKAYIADHYEPFEAVAAAGLDALIITGANVASPVLEEQDFWEPLVKVVDWAENNVASVLCSCLATHAVLRYRYGIAREPLPAKRWGVFPHRVASRAHPLLRDINTRFDAPHSRFNDISRAQLEAAGLVVLADSDSGGVHLAVSPDQCRTVFFQGHPEYDQVSLLKEYKREVLRFAAGERDRPPLPERYFDERTARYVTVQTDRVEAGEALAEDFETGVLPHLDNTWGDTAKAIFNNWLGVVYQLTSLDRRAQFMPGVDPEDPLGLRARDA